MSKFKKAIAWFVIECEEDHSVSLVPKSDVIHTAAVKLEDNVKFKSSDPAGKRRMFKGVVKAIGSEDDKSKLLTLLDELHNQDKEKEGSFHEDRKRKAALDAVSKIRSGRQNNSAAATSGSSISPSTASKVRTHGGRQIVDSDSDSCSDGVRGNSTPSPQSPIYDDAPSLDDLDFVESDESDLTIEEQQVLLKVQELKKRKLAKKLLEIKNNCDDSGSGRREKNPGPSREQSKNVSDSGNKVLTLTSSNAVDIKAQKDKESVSIPSGSAIHRKRKPDVPTEFMGQMFLCDKDTADVVELYEASGVFLDKKKFNNIKCSSTSAGSLARQLMKAIFTSKALETCSLGGNLAFGVGKTTEHDDVRPGLDQAGVDAIFNYTKARQRKKVDQRSWKEMDDSTIKARMRNVLCESRPKKLARKDDGAP